MLPRPSERKHRMHEQKELHITAFLNLMVVLVPFLLLTAVFARMAVIELALPAESKAAQQEDKDVPVQKLELIVSIWNNELSVQNDGTLLEVFKKDGKGDYNFSGLSRLLLQLKQQYPEEKNAVVLSRPNISYKTLVETIDVVREEFSDISLGEI